MDATNPRSVFCQTTVLAADLAKLELSYGACGSDLLAAEVAGLKRLSPARDLQPGNEQLRTSIDSVRRAAFSISEQLTQRFFNLSRTNIWSAFGM
jgi:uncharacterized alpha-E superfamily protein